jgi:hypothetical protein
VTPEDFFHPGSRLIWTIVVTLSVLLSRAYFIVEGKNKQFASLSIEAITFSIFGAIRDKKGIKLRQVRTGHFYSR